MYLSAINFTINRNFIHSIHSLTCYTTFYPNYYDDSRAMLNASINHPNVKVFLLKHHVDIHRIKFSIIPEGYIYFSKYRKVINKRSAIVVC